MQSTQLSPANYSVAVITATIGRDSLIRAIESVAAQTYPCTHYVFVDGEQHAEAARAILANYTQVKAIYLPVNTGANGWYNSHILAMLPFVAQEDIICFLDDDNAYRPNHVESIVNAARLYPGVAYVYTLRNFVNRQHEWLMYDDIESLGHYRMQHGITCHIAVNFQGQWIKITIVNHIPPLIDVNCYALSRPLAQQMAHIWCKQGFGNDAVMFDELNRQKIPCTCTGEYTVDYFWDWQRQNPTMYHQLAKLGIPESKMEEYATEINRTMIQHYVQTVHQGQTPWRKG